MKKECRRTSRLILLLCGILFMNTSYAQLPVCTGPGSGMIYYMSYTTISSPCRIYSYNPSLPTSSTNPVINSIIPPVNANGIALCKNLNGPGPSPTFYTTVNSIYYYYNGASWVNTGHSSGSGLAWNPGGGSNAIYNIDVINREVWKYDGTGNAVKLFNVPTYDGVADIAVDCDGNFYLLRTNTMQGLEKYNSSGTLVATYSVSGLPSAIGGGGISIIGNKLYYDNQVYFLEATISGSNVNFTKIISGLLPQAQDFASCVVSENSVYADVDTAYYCGSGAGIKVKAYGAGPFNWSVLSGNAIITGTGDSVFLTATQTSRILMKGLSSSSSACGSNTDTITLIVPTAVLDAGLDHIVQGCGIYVDTLRASLTNTSSGINYLLSWQPTSGIISGANTLNAVIKPSSDAKYFISASIPAKYGGCIWKDSVMVVLKDVTVISDFDTIITKGCGADTVVFIDKSMNAIKYKWDFGDSNTSTERNPTHWYVSNGIYGVTLVASNNYCSDTVSYGVSIDIIPALKLNDVTADAIIKYGDTIQLFADGALSYKWFPQTFLSNSTIKNPVAKPYTPIKYIVEGINEFGCKDSAIVQIDIDYTMQEYLPSAFSPNGDGLNDKFKILNLKYQKILDFKVFNRFGEIVFQTTNPNDGWDGNYKGVPQELGVYYYLIKVQIPNGEEHFYKGDVTLVR